MTLEFVWLPQKAGTEEAVMTTIPTLTHPTHFETAAEHLTTNIPTAPPDATAGQVRAEFAERRFESAHQIAVLVEHKLVGLVRVEDLLAAPDGVALSALMDEDPPTVAPGVDQEVAAWKAVEHGESSVAVVDEQTRFLGLIPPCRMLSVLLSEHDEDVARFGGFIAGAAAARGAIEEPLAQRLKHRLPWLAVGLLGALAVASIVGAFEAQLERSILLAFFIPSIVYLADAVGAQTEALLIRGLSVGVIIRRVVWGELLTGLLLGLVMGILIFPLVAWRWGQTDIALAVAVSMLATSMTATMVAISLPWAIHRLGYDPAFASGPVATVIVDMLSVAIYLSITSAILS